MELVPKNNIPVGRQRQIWAATSTPEAIEHEQHDNPATPPDCSEPRRHAGVSTRPVGRDRRHTAALVQAAGRGDGEAWKALVGRFSGLVWSIARAHRLNATDAADVSQIVWLRLVEHLDRIRRPEALGEWLAAVTRHECLRAIQGMGRSVPVEGMSELESVGGSMELDADLRSCEQVIAVRRALDGLPPHSRSLLRVMMADPRPSYEEIAAGLGVPIGSIGPTWKRALERLRRCPELRRLRLSEM